MAQQSWPKDEQKPFRIKSNRNSKCAECREEIMEGDDIFWDPKEFKAYCVSCGEDL